MAGVFDQGGELVRVNLEKLRRIAAGGSLRPKPVVEVRLALEGVLSLDDRELGQRLRVAGGVRLDTLVGVGRLADLEDVAAAAPIDVDVAVVGESSSND
ncbi:MAG: hypothetical protein M3546_11250 [Actinomycetota bacterium]|nr:hypothetical protein [Actinomycetota bacterium]